MFKTMGYSPCLLLESGRFSTLRIHPKSTQTVVQAVTNHFRMVLEAIQRVWSDFQDLPKSAMFKTMAIAQAFCSKSANFQPVRIHPKSTQTVAQAVTNYFRTVLEAFQRVWSDFQDLPKSTPCSKAWAIAQAFCSKSADFRPYEFTLSRHKQWRKQSEIILEAVLEEFQKVCSDLQDLPKSAMFKTMGYCPGRLLENGQFSTSTNSP